MIMIIHTRTQRNLEVRLIFNTDEEGVFADEQCWAVTL